MTLADPGAALDARHRHRVPGSGAVREPRRRRQHLPRQGAQPASGSTRWRWRSRLDAAQRAVGAHPERARAGRLAVRRPAPDRGDRPLAAARPEAHPARRADRRAGRRADRRGAQPDRAGARPRPRRHHDQPQHGGRARRRRPHRRAAARPQQRRLHPDASNQELVSAITGATDNAVSRRAGRRSAGARARRHGHEPTTARARRRGTAARPQRRARQARRRRRRRRPRLLRPRPLRRSRLAAGGRRAGDHLDGLPEPQPGLPVAEQSRQPAVRLLDGRRHLARHRLRADGGRDRPVGRLGQRLRLGAGRRALGQPGLAGRAARSSPRSSSAR